ncbi:MAG: hypothetical protein QXH71_02500 [Candidatus Anstonellaceae archaeon]
MNINTFIVYWVITPKQTKAYEKKIFSQITKKEFFNKLLDTKKEEKKILSKEEVDKILKISRGLQGNYLE